MTTTYDPLHPMYLDEADVRLEMARVFDVCSGCRRCADLCGVFPALFELLDHGVGADAGMMTPAQQDLVAGACTHCSLCAVSCPFSPGSHEAAVDVAGLMDRHVAMLRATGRLGGVRDLWRRIVSCAGRFGGSVRAGRSGQV